jgi:hypothetical protein
VLRHGPVPRAQLDHDLARSHVNIEDVQAIRACSEMV